MGIHVLAAKPIYSESFSVYISADGRLGVLLRSARPLFRGCMKPQPGDISIVDKTGTQEPDCEPPGLTYSQTRC